MSVVDVNKVCGSAAVGSESSVKLGPTSYPVKIAAKGIVLDTLILLILQCEHYATIASYDFRLTT